MKTLLFLLLIPVLLFSQQGLREIELENFDNRVITSVDTLKSYWIPIYDAEYFDLFVDFGAQGDSCDAFIAFWLSNGTLSSLDSTTQGFIRSDQSGFLQLKTIGTSALSNNGKFYFSGQYPGNTAVSPARYIQYVIYTEGDHDSLSITSAKFIKYKD